MFWDDTVASASSEQWYILITLLTQNVCVCVCRYGIVEFNVPLDTLQVISEMVLRVTLPNQQRNSTEGRWLVNHVKGQSHQAQLSQLTKR